MDEGIPLSVRRACNSSARAALENTPACRMNPEKTRAAAGAGTASMTRALGADFVAADSLISTASGGAAGAGAAVGRGRGLADAGGGGSVYATLSGAVVFSGTAAGSLELTRAGVFTVDAFFGAISVVAIVGASVPEAAAGVAATTGAGGVS